MFFFKLDIANRKGVVIHVFMQTGVPAYFRHHGMYSRTRYDISQFPDWSR